MYFRDVRTYKYTHTRDILRQLIQASRILSAIIDSRDKSFELFTRPAVKNFWKNVLFIIYIYTFVKVRAYVICEILL